MIEKMLGGGSSSSSSSAATSEEADAVIIKNSNKNNRRFSDEQIKRLESMFKKENKLEPRKKLEMARELGLHPRQVAIWFQNRRARWKSKQVEQDYTNLKADYDTLTHRFESLKKEKHDLLLQLSNLCSQEVDEGISKDLDSGSENGPLEQDMQLAIYNYSDEDIDPTRKEDTNMGISTHVSEEIIHENNNCLFDHSSYSNWWDIWS